MSVVLTVLGFIFKIILFILLGIIALLLLVLICPITYKGAFSKVEEDMQGKASVHDLLFLFGLKAEYQESLRVRVRLLFFTIYDSTKPKKDKETPKHREKIEKESSAKEEIMDQNVESSKPEMVEGIDDSSAGEVTSTEPALNEEMEKAEKPNKQAKTKDSLEEKLTKLMELLCNIDLTIDGVYDKIEHKFEAYQRTTDLMESQLMRNFIQICMKEAKRILKHVLPRTKGFVEFGMEDPATTGYLLGLLSAFSYRKPKKLHIYADFERSKFETDLRIRGHVQPIVPLFVFLRVYFAGHLKEVLRQITITKNKWRT